MPMKLFQRIFATFCMVIICAIFVVSFSFWVVQTRLAEDKFQQQREIEISLLHNVQDVFHTQGKDAARDLLIRWQQHPSAQNIFVIAGDDKEDILDRRISEKEIKHAHHFALKNPNSNLVFLHYDSLGEEYLFFIRHFHEKTMERMPGLLIPGLPLSPIWQEIIILGGTIIIGLLLAYILTNNITRPIHILEYGMNRLAAGELNTRVSQQLDDRKDELAHLGLHFDKMAAQLQKLVERERHLLHHVSHEMRSPLARMQAILGLVQARPEKQEEYLNRLGNELTRMDHLVGELLTLSRLETSGSVLTLEKLPIVPLVQNLLEDTQALAESKNFTIRLNVQDIPETAQLDANESYLYRALDNVIRNSMNYSPQGSVIDITMYESHNHLHIDIEDRGPGIKEEQMPYIFTSFYRASSSDGKPGTGLGLALTKHIVEQHHGKIYAENCQPTGLKMCFVLPKTYRQTGNDKQAA